MGGGCGIGVVVIACAGMRQRDTGIYGTFTWDEWPWRTYAWQNARDMGRRRRGGTRVWLDEWKTAAAFCTDVRCRTHMQLARLPRMILFAASSPQQQPRQQPV
jgi:hypothetical protein